MSQIIAANAFKVVEGRPVTSSRIVAAHLSRSFRRRRLRKAQSSCPLKRPKPCSHSSIT